MAVPPRGRFMAAALLTPLLISLAACGGSSSGGDKDAGENTGTGACPSDISTPASTAVPKDVPAPANAGAPYDYSAQGATSVWFLAIDGTADDLVSIRDAYDKALTAKGYKIENTDAEPGHEAESDFSGPHDGTTNFRPLCSGKVVFRLKLTS
jgi:hypothetical protein